MRKFILATFVLGALTLTCVAPASAQYINYYGQMSNSNMYPLPLPGNPANPYLYWNSPFYSVPTYSYYSSPYYGFNYGYGPYYNTGYYPYGFTYRYSTYSPYGGISYYRTY